MNRAGPYGRYGSVTALRPNGPTYAFGRKTVIQRNVLGHKKARHKAGLSVSW
jgi:hypothetical protein